MRARSVVLAWMGLAVGAGGTAVAQPLPQAAWVVVSGPAFQAGGGPAAVARGWLERAVQAAHASRPHCEPVVDLSAWIEDQLPGDAVRPERVQAFNEVQDLLLEARRLGAELDEAAALRRLARAEARVESHADVPGAAAWLAEVELYLAVVAFQAGLNGLMEVALARAASLDPARGGLRAAEAPPDLVLRAQAIASAVAARPVGEFAVQVEGGAGQAEVFVDDVLVGAAPAVVRVPAGRHVLRVGAPGWVVYGSVLDVREGVGAAVTVRLAEDPLAVAGADLEAAASRADFAGMLGALGRIRLRGAPLQEVWWIEPAPARGDRATVVVCAADGCSLPAGLASREAKTLTGALRSASAPVDTRLVRESRDNLLSWLLEPSAGSGRHRDLDDGAWWARGYVWGPALAGLVGAAAVGAVLLATPEPEERLRVVVYATGLAR